MLLRPGKSFAWLESDQWERYVQRYRSNSVFHHSNWLQLLSKHYRFPLRIAALTQNGRVDVALPFLRTTSLRGSHKLISLPFTDYHPVLGSPSDLEELVHRLSLECQGKYLEVIIRSDQPIPGTSVISANVRHELTTNLPLPEIESGFADSIRRNLRKAQRHGLTFERKTDLESLDTFYRLHVLTRRKLGVPVQSRSYFHRLHRELIESGLGFLGIVRHRQQPIAAVVLLGEQGRLIYKYAASDPASLDLRPNDFLVFQSIKIASENGFAQFDFGLSDKKQSGLRRFKSKWGAREDEIFHSYVIGEPVEDQGPSRALRLAALLIQNSPGVVCRGLGKAFYRYSQ